MTAFTRVNPPLGRYIIRHPITLDFYMADDFKYVVHTDHTVSGLNMHILLRYFTLRGFRPTPIITPQPENYDSCLEDYEIVELGQSRCQSEFIIKSVRTIEVVDEVVTTVTGWLY